MSDDERTHAEKMDAVRTRMVEAFQSALQEFEVEGMLTGFVVVGEYVDKDGLYEAWWYTGTGAPSEGERAGLPSWRVEGLVRKVLRDIKRRNVQ